MCCKRGDVGVHQAGGANGSTWGGSAGWEGKVTKDVLQIWYSAPRYLQVTVLFWSLGKHPQH